MIRDVIAAMLRDRGYTHDDARDPYDKYWYGPTLGVRPILVCAAHEMNRDKGGVCSGYDSYTVSLMHSVTVVEGRVYELGDSAVAGS